MDKLILLRAIGAVLISTIIFSACEKSKNTINVATSSAYPPFEYKENGELKGFDIDLAHLIGKKLKKTIHFQDMSFDSIIFSIKTGNADMAIATIAITPQREKECSFSLPYHFEKMATIFKKDHPLKTIKDMEGKKIACQQGTTMYLWVKRNLPSCTLHIFNMPVQLVEALKANFIDGVLIDEAQAKEFCKRNPDLDYASIIQSPYGHGIALPKNSPLLPKINAILKESKEEIEQLKKKWGL